VVDLPKPYRMIEDFVSGKRVPEVGAEANRQTFERYLVETKGYAKTDIEVDVEIAFEVAGEAYRSQVDLVVSIDGGRHRCMVVKCCAGSLGSREREIVSAARILESPPIPIAVVTDGRTAVILDVLTGKATAEGLAGVPDKARAAEYLRSLPPTKLSAERLRREKLIFRTYDSENVNVARNLPQA
jgi:hypothetical protein